jgi:hypothetical protein
MVVAGGPPVVGAVGAGRRVAARAPQELQDRSVERDQERAGLRAQRPQGRGIAAPEDVGQVDARRVDAGRLQEPVEPGRVRALRKPEAALPPAEAGAVAVDADVELQAHARVRGAQRQHRVGGARRPRHVPGEGAEQARAARAGERGDALVGPRVVPGGALELERHVLAPGRPGVRGVERVGCRPHVAQEGQEPLGDPGASSWSARTG